MKKITTTLILIFSIVASVKAQELPVPSPYAEVMQRVGLTDVKIEYSRPGVKEREIFGGLEPYGQVWRTGANAATKISFSTDVFIMGKKVEAGTYSVVSVPGEEMWEVMLNTDLKVTENSHEAENDILTLEVKPTTLERKVETMTFSFDHVKENSAHWTFAWDNVSWSIPIKVEANKQAMKNIQDKIDEIEGAYGVYNSSARYYLEHDGDLKQALAWSEKSVAIAEKFWNVYTLSRIQAAMGDYKDAIKTAKRSLELSNEANYQPYIKMNEANIAEWSKK